MSTHTDYTGLIVTHDDMTTADVVDFLRGNGQRLCPAGEGESSLSKESHRLGCEMQKLANIIERRGGA